MFEFGRWRTGGAGTDSVEKMPPGTEDAFDRFARAPLEGTTFSAALASWKMPPGTEDSLPLGRELGTAFEGDSGMLVLCEAATPPWPGGGAPAASAAYLRKSEAGV